MSLRSGSLVLLLIASVNASANESAGADGLTADQHRGRALFDASCVFCHGERGHATTLLAKRLGEDRAMLERRTDLTPELIRHVVRHGINSMPWYPRAELSDREVALITAYLTRANRAK